MEYLGDKNIKNYQIFVIVIGLLVVGSFGSLWLSNPDNNSYLLMSVIVLAVFLLINFLYSKVYCISWDKNHIYIKSLYKNEPHTFDELKDIQSVKVFPIVYKVLFNQKKYHFLLSSTDLFKSLIHLGTTKYAEKLLEKVKGHPPLVEEYKSKH